MIFNKQANWIYVRNLTRHKKLNEDKWIIPGDDSYPERVE